MNVEVGSKQQQGIQIGRTVVILDLTKEEKEKEIEHKTHHQLPSRKAIDRERERK